MQLENSTVGSCGRWSPVSQYRPHHTELAACPWQQSMVEQELSLAKQLFPGTLAQKQLAQNQRQWIIALTGGKGDGSADTRYLCLWHPSEAHTPWFLPLFKTRPPALHGMEN